MKSIVLLFILVLVTISCCTDVKVPGVCLGFDTEGEQVFCEANVSKGQCYLTDSMTVR